MPLLRQPFCQKRFHPVNLFSGILRALGNTRAALLFLLLCVALNVLLDWLFVAVFGFDITGAALATVLAQAVCAVCCAVYFLKTYRQLFCRRADIGFYSALVKQTLKFGISFVIHQASLYIGKLLVQGAVNTLGTPGIAAYTAAERIEGFANSFGDSGGQARCLCSFRKITGPVTANGYTMACGKACCCNGALGYCFRRFCL